VNYQGQDYVFVRTKTSVKESSFEKVPVAKGTSDVGYSEITLLKQMPDTVKIVVKGAFFILGKLTNKEGHQD